MSAADITWGPASSWAAAGATVFVATVALLVAFRIFDRFAAPHLRITFEAKEPWCRTTTLSSGSSGYWVRVRVENVGRDPARGCVGKAVRVRSGGRPRDDFDTVPLRWAGVPRSIAFHPIDIRRGQHEFLNVLLLIAGANLFITTHEEEDFDPGFSTELETGVEHVVDVALFADNADTAGLSLAVKFSVVESEISLSAVP